MIKTKKISRISSKIPKNNENDVYVDVQTRYNKIHKSQSEYHTLCPNNLKTDGNEMNFNNGGVIFENYWQGSKVWNKIYDVDIWAHFSLKGKPEHLLWSYKTKNGKGYENHLINNEIQHEYYRWRNEIFSCNNPIKNPCGYKRRDIPKYVLLIDKNGLETKMDFLNARKLIYFQEYSRLIENIPEFEKLKNQYKEGKTIIICEADVTDNEILTLEKLETRLNDPNKKFSHGHCLALKILQNFI